MSFDVAELPQPPQSSPWPSDAPDPAPPSEAPAALETAAPSEVPRDIVPELAPVYFPTGRWDITRESLATLESNAKILLAAGDLRGTVEGHADERGSESYNYVLGMWRAKTVKDQLRSFGVDPARLTILSHGKKSPAAGGSDPDSLARNRRVEIVVHPEP